MKLNRLLPLLILFIVGCSPKPTFNVYITGEHVTWKTSEEKATLGQPYKIYVTVEKGYEVVEDENFIQITNKFYPEGILKEGMWSYSKQDNLLTLFGSMINCDCSVKIIGDLKGSIFTLNLEGENYISKSKVEEINLECPSIEEKIKPKDGYVPPNEITVTEGIEYTYEPETGTDNYILKINNDQFYKDISVNIGPAIKKIT